MYTLRTARSLAAPARALRTGAANYSSTRHYSSTMHDNDPETLEREKQRNLSHTQHKTSTPHEHAPGWNEHLASASEASVKADRSTDDTTEMQRKTVEYVHSRHSPDDRREPREAVWTHDTVLGPLGSKGGQETIVKKTVHDETTEILKDSTASEENVKADRGEI